MLIKERPAGHHVKKFFEAFLEKQIFAVLAAASEIIMGARYESPRMHWVLPSFI